MQAILTKTEKRFFQLISGRIKRGGGKATMSHRAMARRMKCTQLTAYRNTMRLRKKGVIESERNGWFNTYKLSEVCHVKNDDLH